MLRKAPLRRGFSISGGGRDHEPLRYKGRRAHAPISGRGRYSQRTVPGWREGAPASSARRSHPRSTRALAPGLRRRVDAGSPLAPPWEWRPPWLSPSCCGSSSATATATPAPVADQTASGRSGPPPRRPEQRSPRRSAIRSTGSEGSPESPTSWRGPAPARCSSATCRRASPRARKGPTSRSRRTRSRAAFAAVRRTAARNPSRDDQALRRRPRRRRRGIPEEHPRRLPGRPIPGRGLRPVSRTGQGDRVLGKGPGPRVSRSVALRRPQFRLGAVIAIAIAAGLVAWLLLRDDGGSSSKPAQVAGATTTTKARLADLAAKVQHPIFWLGPDAWLHLRADADRQRQDLRALSAGRRRRRRRQAVPHRRHLPVPGCVPRDQEAGCGQRCRYREARERAVSPSSTTAIPRASTSLTRA